MHHQPPLLLPPPPPAYVDPPTPNFYRTADYPALAEPINLLLSHLPAIQTELQHLLSRGISWPAWPEPELLPPPIPTAPSQPTWTILPFCHTFPATPPTPTTWLSSAAACPFTLSLLQQIPHLKTALFSRLAPHTTLTPHRGWADLANHVLRCHIGLVVPPKCGVVCGGETTLHETGSVTIFDDSKLHHAFNDSEEERFVLIFDLLRPEGVPKGTVDGGHTKELNDLIDRFK